MSDPTTLLGLLADDDRLKAVAALALGATTTPEIRDRVGLDARVTGRALARLEDAGVVVAEDARIVRGAATRRRYTPCTSSFRPRRRRMSRR